MCIWLPSNPLMKHDGGVDSVWVRFCNYFLFTAKTHRFVIFRRGSKCPNINFVSLCKIVASALNNRKETHRKIKLNQSPQVTTSTNYTN